MRGLLLRSFAQVSSVHITKLYHLLFTLQVIQYKYVAMFKHLVVMLLALQMTSAKFEPIESHKIQEIDNTYNLGILFSFLEYLCGEVICKEVGRGEIVYFKSGSLLHYMTQMY